MSSSNINAGDLIAGVREVLEENSSEPFIVVTVEYRRVGELEQCELKVEKGRPDKT